MSRVFPDSRWTWGCLTYVLSLGLLGALSSRAGHSILVWWTGHLVHVWWEGTTLQPQLSPSMFPKVSAEVNRVGKCALISIKWSCLGFYLTTSAYFSFGSESAERLKWITVEVYWGFTCTREAKFCRTEVKCTKLPVGQCLTDHHLCYWIPILPGVQNSTSGTLTH